MKITKIRTGRRELPDAILSRLRERVFHVSMLANLDQISDDREIKVGGSPTGSSAYPGRYNSFMRNRGCVSLFDYRSVPQEDFQQALEACSPTQAASSTSPIAIFLLLPRTIPKDLVSWREWRKEFDQGIDQGEMVVPFVEVGHKGPISLELIDEVICIEVDEQ